MSVVVVVEPARQLSIVPNPELQSKKERARDAPRMTLLRAIQRKVDERGAASFEELVAIRDEVERELKMMAQKTKEKTEKEVIQPKRQAPKKRVKKEAKVERFPRLVRRNARRGQGLPDGQTWTEEVVI